MTDLSVLGPASGAGTTSLVDGIRTSLRTAIAQGLLPAGFRLREIPLAEHYGCSTTPVREAIRRLEDEGLVRVYPRRGAEVISVSEAEIEHLYETRMVLECYAARKAAELEPGSAQLAAAGAVLEQQQSAVAQDPELTSSRDADFHREITALCGNPMIAELVDRSTRQIEAVQSRTHADVVGGAKVATAAHEAIFAAIADGEADEAETLMREHLEWAGTVVATSLSERRTEA